MMRIAFCRCIDDAKDWQDLCIRTRHAALWSIFTEETSYNLIDVRAWDDIGFEMLIAMKQHVEQESTLIGVNCMTENIV